MCETSCVAALTPSLHRGAPGRFHRACVSRGSRRSPRACCRRRGALLDVSSSGPRVQISVFAASRGRAAGEEHEVLLAGDPEGMTQPTPRIGYELDARPRLGELLAHGGREPRIRDLRDSARTRSEVPYSTDDVARTIDAVRLAEEGRAGAGETGRRQGRSAVPRRPPVGRTSGRRSTNSIGRRRARTGPGLTSAPAAPRGRRRPRPPSRGPPGCDGAPGPPRRRADPVEPQVPGDLRRLREGDGRGEAEELAFELVIPGHLLA